MSDDKRGAPEGAPDGRDEVAEHRVRREARRLGELVERTADPERTLAWLEAVADEQEETGTMPRPEGLISLRLPPEYLERADELIARAERDPNIAALVVGKVNRSTILRLAVFHGLDVLDSHLPEAPPPRRKRAKRSKRA